jgi:hypothetical protein
VKHIKIVLLTMLMSVFGSHAAMASSASDSLDYAFGSSADISQIELLTPQEMDSTKGDYWNRHFRFGSRGYVFGYHSAHHNFKRGFLQGRRTHLQLTTYRSGVKASQRHYRMALWR